MCVKGDEVFGNPPLAPPRQQRSSTILTHFPLSLGNRAHGIYTSRFGINLPDINAAPHAKFIPGKLRYAK